MPTITTTAADTYNGLGFDISALTASDVQHAVKACWPHGDDYWADQCFDRLRTAATEVLRSAQSARSGAHGHALKAVATRHGYLTAALMDPTACMAWSEARRLLDGCYGTPRAARMLRTCAEELFTSKPVYHRVTNEAGTDQPVSSSQPSVRPAVPTRKGV